MVIVDVERVMIPFIMGSVLCSLVGREANVYCDPGVWELFEGKVVIVDVKWVMIAFIMGSVLYSWVGKNVYCDSGV